MRIVHYTPVFTNVVRINALYLHRPALKVGAGLIITTTPTWGILYYCAI